MRLVPDMKNSVPSAKQVIHKPFKCVPVDGDVDMISDFDPEKLVTSKLLVMSNSRTSPELTSVSIFPICLRKLAKDESRIHTIKLSSVTPFNGLICGNVS